MKNQNQGNLLRGIDYCLAATRSVLQDRKKVLEDSFNYNFHLFQLKNIKEVTKKLPILRNSQKCKINLVKLSYSTKKLEFQTILFPYQLCVD